MFQPQLATSIDPKTLPAYISDDDWWFEQKLDGIRLAVEVTDGRVQGWGRRDNQINVAPDIRKVFEQIDQGRWVFDGEYVGGTYWVFDVVCFLAMDGTTMPYSSRRDILEGMMSIMTQRCPNIRLLPTHRTAAEKQAIAVSLLRAGAEGVMVKHRDAPYYSGKRSQKVLKAKYVKTVDCVVSELWREGKRSMAVKLYDENGRAVDVGSVTMTPANLSTLAVDDVVEIRYLYATAENRLYQPAFLRRRVDKQPEECTLSQLRYTDRTVILDVTATIPE